VTALAKATAKSCAGFDAHKTIPMGSGPIQTDAVCSHPARKWLGDTLIRCAFSMPKSVFFHSKLINQKLYLLFYFQENRDHRLYELAVKSIPNPVWQRQVEDCPKDVIARHRDCHMQSPFLCGQSFRVTVPGPINLWCN
jgi:hypothetical protein